MATKVYTDEHRALFLAAFARHGRKNDAAREAGIRPAMVNKWLREDEVFAGEFDEAQDSFVEVLEGTAFMLAVEGTVKTRYHKDGGIASEERVHATNVLLKLLEANAPEKYRNRTETLLGGVEGKPVDMTDTTFAARLHALLNTAATRKEAGDQPDPFS